MKFAANTISKLARTIILIQLPSCQYEFSRFMIYSILTDKSSHFSHVCTALRQHKTGAKISKRRRIDVVLAQKRRLKAPRDFDLYPRF